MPSMQIIPNIQKDDECYSGLVPTPRLKFRDLGDYKVVLEQYLEVNSEYNFIGDPGKWLPIQFVDKDTATN